MRVLHVGDDTAAVRPCGLTLYSDALMRAQLAGGHAVSYFYSGRHYPALRRPRLKRRSVQGVRHFELIGSPNHSHPVAGTRAPLVDLEEPVGEAAFRTALRESRADIVHIHELSRLPSSVIDVAEAQDIPVVMTLHDYKPLCASVRLVDSDGLLCSRRDVGEDCARNCAGAPAGPGHLIAWTVAYELTRAKMAVPGLRNVDFPLARAFELASRTASRPGPGPVPADVPALPGPAAAYQRRRDVNVERLNRCERLIAPSARVAEVYASLGVDPGRIVVQRLTLPHLEALLPGGGVRAGRPLTFVAPGAGAHPTKGSRVLCDAVETLERTGRGGDYRLIVPGRVESEALERLAAHPGVELTGIYQPDDLDGLLDGADVGLLPSIWEESHGFVGIEMLAKGLPVIGSELGGIPEYVRDGQTGWLNRSASGAELAELMARAIDDVPAVERLRRTVRAQRADLVVPMGVHAREVEAVYDQAELEPYVMPAAQAG